MRSVSREMTGLPRVDFYVVSQQDSEGETDGVAIGPFARCADRLGGVRRLEIAARHAPVDRMRRPAERTRDL